MTHPTAERLARLRARMRDNGIALTVLGPTSHLRWLTGLDPHGDERPVMLFVSQSYAGMLMPVLNAESVRQHTDLPFHCWPDAAGPDAALGDLIGHLNVDWHGAIVSIDEMMRADFALLVLDALPPVRRTFTEGTVSALRSEKTEDDYRALRASALLNDRAVMAGFDALREGISEEEVAEVIRAVYLAEGAEPMFTSVCFGGNGAFCHHHTGKTRLKRGMAVLIDAGARFMGFPSDMTRAGWFGGPPEPEFVEVAAIVEDAVRAALAAARPGKPARAVDEAARGAIAAAGYGEKFLHRTGHGLGLEIHEEPYITGASNRPLTAGNVFSIEPGVYLPGRYGIRLEDIVFLSAEGPLILSDLPRDIILRG